MVQPSNRPNERILAALIAALDSPPEPSPQGSVLSALFYDPQSKPKPAPQTLNLLAISEALTPRPPIPHSAALSFRSLVGSATSAPTSPVTKRNVFYSFHYDDIIRVNNVRNTEQFKAKILEVPQSHYDRSLWETSKRTNPESLKGLIRDGVKNTSVVCVLIGAQTFARPWVRYEIARSVIDQKGLLSIDINSINHHKDRTPHPTGLNPLAFMAVGHESDGTHRLFEKNLRLINGQWRWVWERYGAHFAAVPLPKYLPAMGIGYLRSLDQGTTRYDAVRNDVWKNMAGWLNAAAIAAGRK